jgi:hypothetical protein
MASFIRFCNRNKHLSVFLILLLFPRDISQHGKINANSRLLLNDGKSEKKFIWNFEFEVSAPTAVSEPSYSYGLLSLWQNAKILDNSDNVNLFDQ